jgi:hypothetical protein
MSFNPADPCVRTKDGRNFVFTEPVEYSAHDGQTYRIPTGAQTDGASTPVELWLKFPPFGTYWLAAALHDSAYRGTLEWRLPDGSWTPCMLPKDHCDSLFLEAMRSLNVDGLARETLYNGVRLFGWRAFRDDRSPKPTNFTDQ